MECVLVHGMGHGAWCWDLVGAVLGERGVGVTALDLPLTSFEDDVAAVREAVAAAGEDVVLVGHSYGGSVVSGAGHAASRLVFVAAMMPDQGETTGARTGEHPPTRGLAAVRPVNGGADAVIAPELAADAFYNTCAPEVAAAHVARLRPSATTCFTTPLDDPPAWRTRRSTYLRCLRDQSVHPDLQRFYAERAGAHVVTSDGDHTPMAHSPVAVADAILLDPVSAVPPGPGRSAA